MAAHFETGAGEIHVPSTRSDGPSGFARKLVRSGRVFRAWCSRLLRGYLLIGWIVGLTAVALGSLEGTISKLILSSTASTEDSRVALSNIYFRSVRDTRSQEERHCPTGDVVLSQFTYFVEHAPPISPILDSILPKWVNVVSCTEIHDPDPAYRAYQTLFSKVAQRLQSIARNESTDQKTVKIDVTILPADLQSFASKQATDGILLPPEVQDWITEERTRIKEATQARALLSAFLLLAVLGAFGSLIFLIRDYITADQEKNLSDYIFRPVLGIFLAVAVFVVDVLAHTIISSASILQIRYEPLYILALGAGLLSETAYDWVRRSADSAFARRREDEEDRQRAELGQSVQDKTSTTPASVPA
jgi:hypothetical protein